MNKHAHDHHDHHHGNHSKKGLHKDWRAWLVVLLMLGAMAIYIFSDDEAIQPGGKLNERVPAAAE